MNNTDFYDYGYFPTIGFDTLKKQLEEAGIEDNGCLMFGMGYGKFTEDEGFTPAPYEGHGFMGRDVQLTDAGVETDFCVQFGKGYAECEPSQPGQPTPPTPEPPTPTYLNI